MSGPYRGVNLVLQINDGSGYVTVGVVEGSDIDFGYNGGPEPCFGTRTQSHSAGSKKISFTITRWYYTSVYAQDLLLDLFDNETEFSLKGFLVDKDGAKISTSEIIITGCRLYRWHPRSGGADDILGEEASGFGTDWDFSGFTNVTP
jgi:hypothetical protein